MHEQKWQFWIDRGGTFTDVVARKPDGSLTVAKYLSVNPRLYKDAAVHAIRQLMAASNDQPLPVDLIDAVKLGTTVATNALLEHTGERTAFITTAGFADALKIAYQNRPDIFARKIVLPQPLYEVTIEADERVTASGAILRPIDREKLTADLQRVRQSGVRSCAIVFMHAYRYPEHEQIAAELAGKCGFEHISTSHQTSPLIKFVSRGDTTVADAYLSPILQEYVQQVASALENVRLLFMQSNGGLVAGGQFRGKDSLLSGPAGGIVGAAKTCAAIGVEKIIAFDMGGTSTDVSHFNGEYERRFDNVVAGTRIRAPMMDIHTVAAGGGSIVAFESGRLQVGPQSAGAMPGPACYRNGGPLTVTDCNLLLGRIQSDFFPRIFGEAGDQPLDMEAVHDGFVRLAGRVNSACSTEWTPEQLAEQFLSVAVDKMASAIKKVSIERGHDISDYSLCSFGGAGGQHACKIAEALDLRRIIIHPFAGVLSALGIGLSEIRVLKQRASERVFCQAEFAALRQCARELEQEAGDAISEQGVDRQNIRFERTLLLRYEGTDFPMSVAFSNLSQVEHDFREQHHNRYGFTSPEKALVVEAVCVEAVETTKTSSYTDRRKSQESDSVAASTMYCDGAWRPTRVYRREQIASATALDGPAVVIDDTGTTIVEPGWQAEIDSTGCLILTKTNNQLKQSSSAADNWWQTPDPARLELFNNLFTSIAEEMGLQLQNTSHSVNIKERLDFSCALFDGEGHLIANAPHIPVHLGSMGESVATLIASHKDELRPGDSWVLNNPFNGGTHLPDVTVINPVFVDGAIVFFVASRGHHADIGGITPGSMPPGSTSLQEEGVVIDHFLLVRDAAFREKEIIELLTKSNPYPARNAKQNVADLKAQVAANTRGRQGLLKLCSSYGIDAVIAYMGFVRENAANAVRDTLENLRDGHFTCEMDDGSKISVSVKVDQTKQRARVDFTGTSPQVSANHNAPRSICRAAVLYVFRTLIEQQIPLNDGCLQPIDLIIPESSLLNPRFPAAVVAGNVETSQALTDCLYGALGALAASQGTMNNFTFGNETYQYYETICGGAGAGRGFDGASAVHTHMTNSRLTDPEVLELRFPVILQRFSIREGSGGAGQYHGGDGAIRCIQFCEKMTASILSYRRRIPPFGLAGGEPGKCGVNYVIRADGERIDLPGTASIELSPGDVFVIETPGGGGYGAANGK